MSLLSFSHYFKTDILIGSNDVEEKGFPKTHTLEQMMTMAIEHKCPIIIKNGTNGKWYLKGKSKSLDELKHLIAMNRGLSRDGVDCYLLEFSPT